jgi:gliding motility-associated-like protein
MNKIIVIIASLVSLQVWAQTDTRFWFVAPNANPYHTGTCNNVFYPGGQPSYFRFSTTNTASTVTITMPANAAFPPIVLNIPANSTGSTNDLSPFIGLFASVNLPLDNPNKCGFYITATTPVTAYYEIANCQNSDLFSLKGFAALGDTFYIPGPSEDGSLFFYYSSELFGYVEYYRKRSFDIVATEDNTVVHINPTTPVYGFYNPTVSPTVIHPANVPFVKTLNKGETYSCWVVDTVPNNNHLFATGSFVTSNKFIAITRTDDDQGITNYNNNYGSFNSIALNSTTGADMNGDQIVPVDYIGSSYIVNRGDLDIDSGGYDLAYITSTVANTKVTLTGARFTANGSNVMTLVGPPGTSAEIQIRDSFATANSVDQPFYLYQVTGYGAEDAGAILPPVDQCTGTNQVGVYISSIGLIPQYYQINLIIRTSAQDPNPEAQFKAYVNGVLNAPITAVLTNPNTYDQINANWKVASIDLTTLMAAGSTLILSNPSAKFLMGFLNGVFGATARYGYFAGFGDAGIRAYISGTDTTYSPECLGQSVSLIATGGTSYTWSSKDYTVPPSQVNQQYPTIPLTSIGTYTFKVVVGGVCTNLTDSTYITVKVDTLPAKPFFTVGSPSVCSGINNVPYAVNNDPNITTYTWRYTGTGLTFHDDSASTVIIDFADISTSGTLWAIASNNCGADSVSMAISFSNSSNGGILKSDTTVCSGANVKLTLTGKKGTVQEWQSSPDSTTWTNLFKDSLTAHTIDNITQTTYYLVMVQNAGCPAVNSSVVTVTVHPVPVITKDSSTSITGCGLTDGTITVSAAPAGNIKYSIDSIHWQISNTFDSLSPGSYFVWAENSTDSHCITKSLNPAVINGAIPPSITKTSSTNISDCNKQDGKITVLVSGGTGSYEFSDNGGTTWSNTSGIFADLDSGSYHIMVRNSNQTCPVNGTIITITAPAAPIPGNIVTTNETSCSAINGKISISASGGLGTYQFSINDGLSFSPSGNFTDLSAGNYIIKIKNSDGTCEINDSSVTITVPQQNSGIALAQPAYCSRIINLFQSLQDSTYDSGGDWLSGNNIIDSITTTTNANPGTNIYTYYLKATGGCAAKSTSVIVYVDSIPPRLTCIKDTTLHLDFLTPYYIANDSLNPLSVNDNCNYSLKNSINDDSTITGVHIDNSTVIKWTATDISGNSNTCEINVTVLRGNLPNTISPNGDYINDAWEVKLSQYYPDAIVQIYNRWGELIWVSDKGYDTNQRLFDGHDSNGQKVPVDSYQYLISNDSKIISKGFISVIY